MLSLNSFMILSFRLISIMNNDNLSLIYVSQKIAYDCYGSVAFNRWPTKTKLFDLLLSRNKYVIARIMLKILANNLSMTMKNSKLSYNYHASICKTCRSLLYLVLFTTVTTWFPLNITSTTCYWWQSIIFQDFSWL